MLKRALLLSLGLLSKLLIPVPHPVPLVLWMLESERGARPGSRPCLPLTMATRVLSTTLTYNRWLVNVC